MSLMALQTASIYERVTEQVSSSNMLHDSHCQDDNKVIGYAPSCSMTSATRSLRYPSLGPGPPGILNRAWKRRCSRTVEVPGRMSS